MDFSYPGYAVVGAGVRAGERSLLYTTAQTAKKLQNYLPYFYWFLARFGPRDENPAGLQAVILGGECPQTAVPGQ